jgi:hypothetical protein
MRFTTVAWLGVFGLVQMGPAFALTISNIDPKTHTVTVTEGGKANKLTIDSKKEVEAPCAGGCKVKLDNGEEYQLKGGESVSIEDSAVFVDSSPDAYVEDLPNLDPDNVPDEPQEEDNSGDDDSDDADADASASPPE